MKRQKMGWLLIILHCILFSTAAASGCGNATTASRLRSVLLAEYERSQRPDRGDAALAPQTQVALALSLRHGRLDETTATAVVLADLYLAWMDRRLSWNASDWGGVESVYLSSDAVWRPDITLLNAQEIDSEEPARVATSSDGAALWVPRMQLSVPCALTMDAWPRDEHVCQFEFGSRTYSKSEIAYYFMSYVKGEAPERSAGDWAVTVAESQLVEVRRRDVTFEGVRWSVRLRRRGDAHATAALAASAVVALLLVAAMLTAPECRAPLHAAAAVAATAQLATCVLRLPPAAGAPRLLRLHAALLGLAAAGVVASALVLRVAAVDGATSQRLRRLLYRTAALSGYREDPTSPESEGVAMSTEASSRGRTEWRAVATLLDIFLRALTCLIIVVLLICYT